MNYTCHLFSFQSCTVKLFHFKSSIVYIIYSLYYRSDFSPNAYSSTVNMSPRKVSIWVHIER